MKSFKQFMTEIDADELGGASVRQSGEGGRVYRRERSLNQRRKEGNRWW